MRGCAVVVLAAGSASGQATQPIAFVANNGNLEGSVSSYAIFECAAPVVLSKFITGARGSTSQDEPGANVISLDLSPSGRYIATGHASGSLSGDQVTILEVAANGSLSLVLEKFVPETSFSVLWMSETLLAVTQTQAFGTNELVIFDFDPSGPTLTEVSRALCGTFATKLTKHPTLPMVYVNDSGSVSEIRAFSVGVGGALTQVQQIGLAHYPLGIEVGPDGRYLYAAGGISNGGNKFSIFSIGPTGLLTGLAGNPFVSPGSSPKEFAVDPSGTMLFVEHGTDATIRSFFLDAGTGAATSTGQSFDVGLQGTLGATATWRGVLFATDESTAIDGVRGLYALAVDPGSGAMTPINAVPVDSTGITPESIVIWDPTPDCAADLNDDGVLDFFDIQVFLALFSVNDPAADLNGDMVFDFFDIQEYLSLFSQGCP